MLITGCMRSGTKTIAAVLRLQHEKQFHPGMDQANPPINYINEVSWIAAPFIDQLKPVTAIIHLIRHPLAVIRSIVGTGFFNLQHQENLLHEPFRNFLYDYMPELEKLPPELAATEYWIGWNEMITNASIPAIRIEDIINAPIINSRTRADISWKDIANPRLEKLTKLYGYTSKLPSRRYGNDKQAASKPSL